MSAALALTAARAAGVEMGIDGDDLILDASTPPPAAVLDLLTRHKADIVDLLRPGGDRWSTEDWHAFFNERAGTAEFDGGLSRVKAEAHAFACCITEWLNRNPVQSLAGRCVFCGRTNSPGAVVLPFGTAMQGHAWLHAECWPAWYRARQLKATAVLRALGLKPATASDSSSKADSHQNSAEVEP